MIFAFYFHKTIIFLALRSTDCRGHRFWDSCLSFRRSLLPRSVSATFWFQLRSSLKTSLCKQCGLLSLHANSCCFYWKLRSYVSSLLSLVSFDEYNLTILFLLCRKRATLITFSLVKITVGPYAHYLLCFYFSHKSCSSCQVMETIVLTSFLKWTLSWLHVWFDCRFMKESHYSGCSYML